MFKLHFAIAGILIALGYIWIPNIPDELGSGPFGGIEVLVWICAIAPTLPLSIAVINAMMRVPLNKPLAIVFAVLVAIVGTLISLLNAALSGVGTSIALGHGLSLTVAVTASILLLSAQRDSSALRTKPFLVLIVPVIIALWSLASVGAIAWQAQSLSGGHPFCLGFHARNGDIEFFRELRGLSFYSTATGYKDSSRWYFHGILIVDTPAKREIYNWSPRRMTFHRIGHPRRLIADPTNVCTPRKDFWETLSIW